MEHDLIFDGAEHSSSRSGKDYGERPTVHTTCYDKQVITYWINV